MKIYQLISAADGSRSPVLTTESLQALAEKLAPVVEKNPERGNDYVLLLIEDADGQPFSSRAPLMHVSSVVSLFRAGENK